MIFGPHTKPHMFPSIIGEAYLLQMPKILETGLLSLESSLNTGGYCDNSVETNIYGNIDGSKLQIQNSRALIVVLDIYLAFVKNAKNRETVVNIIVKFLNFVIIVFTTS